MALYGYFDINLIYFLLPPSFLFEYKVLPFGLARAPGSFQASMQAIFGDALHKFVLVYLDDILVISESEEEHIQHLRFVLDKLREFKFYAKLSKCSFFQQEVSYLGHRVGNGTLKVDPDKVKQVLEWPKVTNVSQLRSFLGLVTYFRRFIPRFAQTAHPLYNLLKKHVAWRWTPACDAAFEHLRQALVNPPVLKLPAFGEPFTVIVDASLHGVGAILVQEGRPVAYESRSLTGAEQRYTTGDQELLAVMHAFKKWRCYLEGVPVIVVTDHNPNTYLSTQLNLSRRQARWFEYLQRFDFTWEYRKGTSNPADSLSRLPGVPRHSSAYMHSVRHVMCVLTRAQLRAGSSPACVSADHAASAAVQHGVHVDVPVAAMHSAAVSSCAVVAPAGPSAALHLEVREDAPVAAMQPLGTLHADGSDLALDLPQRQEAADLSGEEDSMPDLLNQIRAGYSTDEWLKAYIQRHHPNGAADGTEQDTPMKFKVGLWYRRQRVYVPDAPGLRHAVIREVHDSPYCGHVGPRKTLTAISRLFYWPCMKGQVIHYVRSCLSCQHHKASNKKRAGLLQPLPIPGRRWQSIACDFITGLPMTKNGYNAILVFVDRLSKMVHLVPTTDSCTSQEFAKLFVHNVWRMHGIPMDIVCDRGTQFASEFWSEVCSLIGTRRSLSSAWHPESDGITERYNRVLQDMIRHYVRPTRDDWDLFLDAA